VDGEWYLDITPVKHEVAGDVPGRDREQTLRRQVKDILSLLVGWDNRHGGENVRLLVDPQLRTKFIARRRDEFGQEWFEGRFGLAMFDHSVLGRPLSEFGISKVEFDEGDPDRATVTIACGDESLRFRVVRRDGRGSGRGFAWHLALEPVERYGPGGRIWSMTERGEIRKRIEEMILALPKEPDLADLEPVLPAIDPRERERLKALPVEELREFQRNHRLGIALLDPAALPDGHPTSSASDVEVRGDSGTHTWHLGKSRVVFPIVRVEGKWYAGVGRVRIFEAR